MEQHQHDPAASGERWSYAKFVKTNPAAARTLESLLQYAGFFAPARFAERDLSIESGYALSSLAALAHDRILLRGQENLGQGSGEVLEAGFGGADGSQSPASSTGLDPKRWGRPSSAAVFADRMRVALATIARVQVVVEKLANQHGSPRRRREVITYLEMLKALSRLLLLACTREMLMGGGAYVPGRRRSSKVREELSKLGGVGPWREADLGALHADPPQFNEFADAAADRPSSPSRRSPEVYTGKRSGVRLIVPPRASVIWSGRGRSNRPIGVGRAATTSFSPSSSSSCDGSSCGHCSERNPSEGHCGASPAPDGGGSNSRIVFIGIGSDGGSNEGAAGCRHHRQSQKCGSGVGWSPSGVSKAWLIAGEVIHILRPLIYSHSCRAAGERSWRPWLTSLGMDAAAFACTARAGGGGAMALLIPIGEAGGVPVLPYLDEEQAAELRRRKLLWLLYLMRSPAFELLAEPASRGVAGVFEGVPLLGGMAGYALNMLLYVQRHHFYTSAS